MTDYASGLQPQSTMDQLLAAEQDKWLADAKAAVKQRDNSLGRGESNSKNRSF